MNCDGFCLQMAASSSQLTASSLPSYFCRTNMRALGMKALWSAAVLKKVSAAFCHTIIRATRGSIYLRIFRSVNAFPEIPRRRRPCVVSRASNKTPGLCDNDSWWDATAPGGHHVKAAVLRYGARTFYRWRGSMDCDWGNHFSHGAVRKLPDRRMGCGAGSAAPI